MSVLPSDKENQARFAALPARMGCIVLAAGAGQRMGHRPKCLLQLNGVSLLERQLQALSEVGGAPLVVVLGHHAARIQQEEALTRWAVRTSVNVHPDDGHVSSLRTGLQALPWPLDAVLVALADQPLINSQDINDLIGAYKKRPAGAQVVQPSVDGQPGNPVMFSQSVREQILAGEARVGCKQWQSANPQAVHPWASSNQRYRTDVDTPEDIEALATRTGHRLRWPADLMATA